MVIACSPDETALTADGALPLPLGADIALARAFELKGSLSFHSGYALIFLTSL